MNLKAIRKSKKMTQREISDILCCSPVVYSRYETGERQPSIDMLIKLADLFNVSVDFLIGREDVAEQGLSEYEIKLVSASRSADERARNDALNLLVSNSILKN